MSSIKVEAMEVVEEPLELPPGFRFHPSDEEIISHYLMNKAMNEGFHARAIGEADFNKSEPWDLPGQAKMGEKEWYFFCRRERRYPTGMRTNRATLAGYWKATGKDKEIYKGKNYLVGMKKTLVFYKGRAPKGEKTNWVMHEYRLEGNFSDYNIPPTLKDSWVVCRVFHKSSGLKKAPEDEDTRADSQGMEPHSQDDYFSSSSIPSFLESPHCDPNHGSSYFLEDRDFKSIPSSSSSSSYPSFLPSTMDMGNIQAFQSNTPHHNPLQINPFNPEKRPIGYPHAYHYFQTLPSAGVYIPERNHDFPLQEKAILRGPAAVSQPTGGVPLDNLIEHR